MTKHDSLQHAKRLEQAGVPKEQAAVHAAVLAEALSNVVSTAQMQESMGQLRQDMANMEARLVSRIELLRTEVHARIDTLEASLRGEITMVEASLRGEITMVEATLRGEINRVEATLRGEITRVEESLRGEIKKLHWMFATLVVSNFAIIAKLFFS